MTESAPSLSRFAIACISGKVEEVKRALKEVNLPGIPSKSLIDLLETRATSMRLSPLLLIVSMGKNLKFFLSIGRDNSASSAQLYENQMEVVKVLLQYGARPDAKDVVGKTIFHYGSGIMATPTTMKIASMCMLAAESSHLFGKECVLHGLKKEDMNGKKCIARGYHVDDGRRVVYLMNEEKEISVKPDNILLANEATPTRKPKLCDVQDRLGGTCLLEVFMSQKTDIAKFLLTECGASIDVADWDGFSPKSMTTRTGGSGMASAVSPLIMKAAMQQARDYKKQAVSEIDTRCANCNTVADASVQKDFAVCSSWYDLRCIS
jgi:hypothetical protein